MISQKCRDAFFFFFLNQVKCLNWLCFVYKISFPTVNTALVWCVTFTSSWSIHPSGADVYHMSHFTHLWIPTIPPWIFQLERIISEIYTNSSNVKICGSETVGRVIAVRALCPPGNMGCQSTFLYHQYRAICYLIQCEMCNQHLTS